MKEFQPNNMRVIEEKWCAVVMPIIVRSSKNSALTLTDRSLNSPKFEVFQRQKVSRFRCNMTNRIQQII